MSGITCACRTCLTIYAIDTPPPPRRMRALRNADAYIGVYLVTRRQRVGVWQCTSAAALLVLLTAALEASALTFYTAVGSRIVADLFVYPGGRCPDPNKGSARPVSTTILAASAGPLHRAQENAAAIAVHRVPFSFVGSCPFTNKQHAERKGEY